MGLERDSFLAGGFLDEDEGLVVLIKLVDFDAGGLKSRLGGVGFVGVVISSCRVKCFFVINLKR